VPSTESVRHSGPSELSLQCGAVDRHGDSLAAGSVSCRRGRNHQDSDPGRGPALPPLAVSLGFAQVFRAIYELNKSLK
jgi:hypothetical protein